MFGKNTTLFILFLMVLVACSGKKSPNPLSGPSPDETGETGTLVLNVTVAPWSPVLAKNAAVQAMDSVKVLVYSSSGSRITQQLLTKSGNQWKGNITVTAQNNMKVVLAYYGGSVVRYLGEKTGVTVSPGETATVDISVNYMGISITAPDSATADFKVIWMSRPLATKYELQEDTRPDFGTAKMVYSGTDTTYTIPIQGKVTGQAYYYRTRANTPYGYGPWYSKGSDSTMGNISGTIVIDTPDLPDEMGELKVIQGITLMTISGGTFQMGDPTGELFDGCRPVHTVTLSGFELGTSEVTQAQYTAIMSANPSHFSGDSNLPVEMVSWWDAIQYCNALSIKAGLAKCYNETTGACDFTKNGFRLPTEAEWEYACRAGTTTNFNLGDADSDLDRAGWYAANSSSKTHPVRNKTPNTWGLYDMHGNVSEWCNDWFGSYTSANVTEPKGPQTGEYRMLRGGSWGYFSNFLRSAKRDFADPDEENIDIGFRVCRGVLPQ